ncbi:FKBP-type peptidyl-prolyl cis-trans isomerase [Psychrobacter sp. I-STPA10]|uniref:FKBP-type peptidyl-prolyl cis-trans isomerase n=1 Tax=Psychrobacter sp. I-STPA10 TaxID=2585769 RepID=UPI001E452638|nr:FKBP-type peptidyl-prolyl cis-trans isomerase [Psychrobacter sp. I-STPA10]
MSKKITPARLLVLGLSTAVFATACANGASDNSAKNDTTEKTTVATNNANGAAITEQSTELQKVGYSLGYMMAQSNKGAIDDLDLDTFDAGFRDGYTDKKAALTQEQMEEVLTSYQKRKEAEFTKELQEKAEKNKTAGAEYLAANAKKEGVVTTDSGLQYKVLKQGTGPSPTANDLVQVQYEGKLIDGTVFDSSYERGEPAIFAVKDMIPGFSEGLEQMKEGGKYELYIPADIAYGETGNPAIEPNSTLIFTVEMLKVNPELPKAPGQ